MPIRILIAEHEAVYRAGLRVLLDKEPQFSVVGEVENGAGVLKAGRLWETDVLLLDIQLPGPPSSKSIIGTFQNSPRPSVLAIVMKENRWYVQDLLGLGASGCILKESTESKLVQAVKIVADGQCYVDSELADPGAEAPCTREQLVGHGSQGPPSLSSIEQDVGKLLVSGFTHAEIAEQLGLSKDAVVEHRNRIMDALGLRSRAELADYAVAHRLWHTG